MLNGDGHNTDPQSMDYPNGLPLKILFQMNTTLRSCDSILTLHEPAYFCSAWPEAAILNNYTDITTAGHKNRRFKPREVNFRRVLLSHSFFFFFFFNYYYYYIHY